MPKPESLAVHPSRLRPNPWNTNIVSPDNEAKLAASIEELGQFKPIIVRELWDENTDTDYEILGGEHRWQTAIEQGLDEVFIFNLGPIDDVKAKKITLADNARYGADDTVQLAKLLEEIGGAEEVQSILPYTDAEISAIFSASDIALGELDLPEGYEENHAPAEPKAEKAAKTHALMRFKVPLGDNERIIALITKTQKRQGFTTGDDLTNAGDALVHLLLSGSVEDAADAE